MVLIRSILHILVASMVSLCVWFITMNLSLYMPTDWVTRWPIYDAFTVLACFAGGCVMGLAGERLRRSGIYVGLPLPFFSIWQATRITVDIAGYMHFPPHVEHLLLSRFLWQSAVLLLCCIVVGYGGQLWVGRSLFHRQRFGLMRQSSPLA